MMYHFCTLDVDFRPSKALSLEVIDNLSSLFRHEKWRILVMTSGFREMKEFAMSETLKLTGGNISLAARRLKISRSAATEIINRSPKLRRLVDELRDPDSEPDDDEDFE